VLCACGVVIDAAESTAAAAAVAAVESATADSDHDTRVSIPPLPSAAAADFVATVTTAATAASDSALLFNRFFVTDPRALAGTSGKQSSSVNVAGDWAGVLAMRGGRCATRVEVARLLVLGGLSGGLLLDSGSGVDLLLDSGSGGGLLLDSGCQLSTPQPISGGSEGVPARWLAAGVLLARRGEWRALQALAGKTQSPKLCTLNL
jgi:hypothetical protein